MNKAAFIRLSALLGLLFLSSGIDDCRKSNILDQLGNFVVVRRNTIWFENRSGRIDVLYGRQTPVNQEEVDRSLAVFIAISPGRVFSRIEENSGDGPFLSNTTLAFQNDGEASFGYAATWNRERDDIGLAGRVYPRSAGNVFLIYSDDGWTKEQQIPIQLNVPIDQPIIPTLLSKFNDISHELKVAFGEAKFKSILEEIEASKKEERVVGRRD